MHLRTLSRHVGLTLLGLGFLLSCSVFAGEPDAAGSDFFEKEVRPVLHERCIECHGDRERPKAGLRLTSREAILKGGDSGPAVVVGAPDESLLIEVIHYIDEPRMPPKAKLADREIATLTRWVAMGLPWPKSKPSAPVAGEGKPESGITDEQRRFWSFQPVREVSVPQVQDRAWARTDIDRFILATLEAKGLRPAPHADKRTLIRRATFDLTGLPPTPEEVDAFLADQTPESLATRRRSAARLAALRRALGAPLARRRSLRRLVRRARRGRHWRYRRGLALSRLGRRCLQPRPSLSTIL